MGLRDWSGRVRDGFGSKSNQVGIVYPAPAGQGFVDLPVFSPTANRWTTAWSGQVPVLDPGEQLDVYATQLRGGDPAQIFRTQPAVRKVTQFIARNVASTSIKPYNRVSDTTRRPVDGPLAELLRQPAPNVVPFRLWNAVVLDGLLWDRWCLWKVPADTPAGIKLVRIPPRRFRFVGDSLDQLTSIRLLSDRTENPWVDKDPGEFVFDYGYSPLGAGGLSPMETLAETLAESAEARRWRRQVWANGARMSGWIERPTEANGVQIDGFDAKARRRLLAEWEGNFGGPAAAKPGGTGFLDDGMTYKEAKQFSAKDMTDVEHRRLTDAEVASAYHIAPESVGAREANYSNMREIRQRLYRDDLGPYFTPIKQALNLMLVPDYAGRKKLYVDFDLESKLRGSFEERAALTSTAVGAPWLTRNEARAQENREPIDGGDEIITPLNVLVGDQPSPQTPTEDGSADNTAPPEAPPEPKALGRGGKSLIPDATRGRLLADYVAELGQFATRQAAALSSSLGADLSLPTVWNGDRWDRELKRTLNRHLQRTAELRSATVGSQLDTTPDLDELHRRIDGRAGGIAAGFNAKTYSLLATAVVDDDPAAAVAAVLAAVAGRTARIAQTSSTEITCLAAVHAAEDAGPVFKRWVVRAPSPRKSHAALSGEVVPLDAAFSNGGRYPGAGNLPADERSHCTCDVELQREET